jgi:MFS family permease
MKTILSAFAVKPFAHLWISEILTQVSVNIFNFCLIFIVFSLTNSNTAVAIAVLSFTLPAVFIGVIAGVYVDYWNKKKVLLVTNIIRAMLLLLLIPFSSNLYGLYLFSLLFTIATQFFIPAETPMIPVIVPKRFLYAANALFGLGVFGSILVAFIISGPILLYFGKNITLGILSLFLFASALFVLFVRTPKAYDKKIRERTKSVQKAIRQEIFQALKVMSSTRDIHHSLLLLAVSQILILIIAVLAPGYAHDVLFIPIEEFPLRFIAPAALGVLVGTVILINFFEKFDRNKIITSGIFLSGIALLLLPYGSKIAARDIVQSVNTMLPGVLDITPFQIVAILAFLLGFANAFVFVPANTILQERTTDEIRGKVYGVLNTIVGIFSLLPVLIAGGLSDLIGVTYVIVGLGVFLLLFGFSKVIFRL